MDKLEDFLVAAFALDDAAKAVIEGARRRSDRIDRGETSIRRDRLRKVQARDETARRAVQS
jgi:hypothetical protein